MVFEDAPATLDAGDLIASFNLAPNELGPVVMTTAKQVRYKVRANSGSAWRWGSKASCSGGAVIKL